MCYKRTSQDFMFFTEGNRIFYPAVGMLSFYLLGVLSHVSYYRC